MLFPGFLSSGKVFALVLLVTVLYEQVVETYRWILNLSTWLKPNPLNTCDGRSWSYKHPIRSPFRVWCQASFSKAETKAVHHLRGPFFQILFSNLHPREHR